MIYLAVPYTGHEERSFWVVNKYAGMLMNERHFVFSPISHTHPIATQVSLPRDFEYWRDYNYHMLDLCDVLVVLMLDGWQDSTGVSAEIKYAEKIGMPVIYRHFDQQPSGIVVTDAKRA